MSTEEKIIRKKRLQGKVVSTKMNKTISVYVERYFRHPKYKKRILRTKKFLVHDENNLAEMNDKVEIIECRPLSKRKKFSIIKNNWQGCWRKKWYNQIVD